MKRALCMVFLMAMDLSLSVPAARAADCSDVLGNVYDRTSVDYSGSSWRAAEHFFCENSAKTDKEVIDTSGSADVLIKGVPTQFNGKGVSDKDKSYSQAVCQATRSSAAQSDSLKADLQTINTAVINAWAACMQQPHDGMRYWAETDDQARTVTFNAIWGHSTSDKLLKLPNKALTFKPSGVLDCKPDQFQSPLGVQQVVVCSRLPGADGNRAVTAKLATSGAGSRIAKVPVWRPEATHVDSSKKLPYCDSPKDITGAALGYYSTSPADAYYPWAASNSQRPAPVKLSLRFSKPVFVRSLEMVSEQADGMRRDDFEVQVEGKPFPESVGSHHSVMSNHGNYTQQIGTNGLYPVTSVSVNTTESGGGWVAWNKITVFGCEQPDAYR